VRDRGGCVHGRRGASAVLSGQHLRGRPGGIQVRSAFATAVACQMPPNATCRYMNVFCTQVIVVDTDLVPNALARSLRSLARFGYRCTNGVHQNESSSTSPPEVHESI